MDFDRRGSVVPGPEIWDRDPALPDPTALGRVGGRLLDPQTASREPGAPAPRVTAYVGSQLLVSAARADQIIGQLNDKLGAQQTYGWSVRRLDRGTGNTTQLGESSIGVVTLEIVAGGGRQGVDGQPLPTPAPDAWELLALARTRLGRDALAGVGLNHVVQSGIAPLRTHFEPNPTHFEPNPDEGFEYRDAGGRLPVAYTGRPPARTPDSEWKRGRRPVVAVLDTGCGEHEWLEPYVIRDLQVTDPATGTLRDIGYGPLGPNPEVGGDFVGPLDGVIDAFSAHGTFICGLVRQGCPDANLLAWRVVPSEGLIVEGDWLNALVGIAELARQYAAGTGTQPIDVLNLSMGYYHESPEDAATFDPGVIDALTVLGRAGVAVVCSAGNDATARPIFPAAYAPFPGVTADPGNQVPLTSVGALNANGTTVASFSNTGDWVKSYQPGASVFSTMPPFQGGLEPAVRTVAFGLLREAKDPDNFTRPLVCGHDPDHPDAVRSCGGFGLWNGTSFSAPVQAGLIASHLQEALRTGSAKGQAVTRGRAAVAGTLRRPPARRPRLVERQ